MKEIMSLVLLLSNISVASPANGGNLKNNPKVAERIELLKSEGWQVNGQPTQVPLESFYFTNSEQGQTVLFAIPIYSKTKFRTSCLAAIFFKGAGENYSFRDFVQIAGFCE